MARNFGAAPKRSLGSAPFIHKLALPYGPCAGHRCRRGPTQLSRTLVKMRFDSGATLDTIAIGRAVEGVGGITCGNDGSVALRHSSNPGLITRVDSPAGGSVDRCGLGDAADRKQQEG